jgi:hypothetical protein
MIYFIKRKLKANYLVDVDVGNLTWVGIEPLLGYVTSFAFK